MYQVSATGQQFQSFMAAIAAAKAANSEVFEVATGIRRWAPAAPIAAKKIRRYVEQAAARAAYEDMKAR